MATQIGTTILGTDGSIYNSANPYGFGTIYGSGSLSRIIVGATTNNTQGYSLISNSNAGSFPIIQTYNNVGASSSYNAYVTFYIKFISFSTTTFTDVPHENVLIDFFDTVGGGGSPWGGGTRPFQIGGTGASITINTNGLLQIHTNYTTYIDAHYSLSNLSLHKWYKFVVETMWNGNRWYALSVGELGGPVVPLINWISTSSPTSTYIGLTNAGFGGNAKGYTALIGGVKYYKTTAYGAPYNNGRTYGSHVVSGSNIITTEASANSTGLSVGQLITLRGFPKGTTITQIDNPASTNSTIHLSNTATFTANAGAYRFFCWNPADSAEYANFPTDLYDPLVSPFVFHINNNAIGGGTGEVGNELTWAEACAYAPYISSDNISANFVNNDNSALDITSSVDVLAGKFESGEIKYNPNKDKYILDNDILGISTIFNSNCELDGQGFTIDGTVALDVENATQYDAITYPNVWKIAHGGAINTALFRGTSSNGIWLGRCIGPATPGTPITSIIVGSCTESGNSYVNVATAINSLPDTHWADNTYFYFSTKILGENPTTNGDTYFRTMSGSNYSAIGANGYIHDLTIKGTLIISSNGGDVMSSYGFLAPDYNLNVYKNINTRFCGFHSAGVNTSSINSNGRLVILNIDLGACWPCYNKQNYRYWYPFGNNAAWVSYNDRVGVYTQHYLKNITTSLGTDGLIGSTIGFNNYNVAAILSHNADIETTTIQALSGQATTGNFTLSYNGNPTSSLAYNSNSSAIQSAIRLLPGLSGVTVTGNLSDGDGVIFTFSGTLGLIKLIISNAGGLTWSSGPTWTYNAANPLNHQMQKIFVVNCNVGGYVSFPPCVASATITNTSALGFQIYNGTGDYLTSNTPISGLDYKSYDDSTPGTFAVTHSVEILTSYISFTNNYRNGVTFDHCVFDHTDILTDDTQAYGVFVYGPSCAEPLTVTKSIIISPSTTNNVPIYSGFSPSKLTANENIYVLLSNASSNFSVDYNGTTDYSFATWQGVSQDANSSITIAPTFESLDLNFYYIPYTDSPAVDFCIDGSNAGWVVDSQLVKGIESINLNNTVALSGEAFVYNSLQPPIIGTDYMRCKSGNRIFGVQWQKYRGAYVAATTVCQFYNQIKFEN